MEDGAAWGGVGGAEAAAADPRKHFIETMIQTESLQTLSLQTSEGNEKELGSRLVAEG